MKDDWEIGEKDVELLEAVATKAISIVAREYAEKMGWDIIKAEQNVRSWLHRIRVRVKRSQTYINKIYALQRKYPRIRKLTTSGALPDSLDEIEEF